jgi:hypothetical protein
VFDIAEYDDRMALYENRELFYFGEYTCKSAGFRTGFLCGFGKCLPCPRGHYCVDGQRPTPCPPGMYQNETGKTRCKMCTLISQKGACLPAGKTVTDSCDIIDGLKDLAVPCGGECDARASNATLGADTCTCPDRVQGKTKTATGACVSCVQCQGPKFARPTNAPYYCISDAAQCQLMYYDDFSTANYKCGTDLECMGLDHKSKIIVDQAMPWREG